MLVVLAIMMLMMTMGMVAFMDWGKSTAMKGAMLDIKSAITSTRQWAITKRMKTSFLYTNFTDAVSERGSYMIKDSNGDMVGNVGYLPKGVKFDMTGGEEACIEFKSDGSGTWGDTARHVIIMNKGFTNEMTVYPLTGRSKQTRQE